MRTFGLIVSHFLSFLYILSILMPTFYCLHHKCSGPDLDGFMPAFMLIPFGGIATVFTLQNAIRQIKKKHPWSWAFRALAIICATVLVSTVGFIAVLVYEASVHH